MKFTRAPGIVLVKSIEHLADAGEQAFRTELEGGIDVAIASLEPEYLVFFALLPQALRRDAEVLGDLRRGQDAPFGFEGRASFPRRARARPSADPALPE
jgi:hypothetical protein